MMSWQESFFDRVDGIMWPQWIALGAALAGKPCRQAIVDPEALLVASCSLGRYNPRLFDESLDWTITNQNLLKTSRLRFIASEYDTETRRTLAAFADYVSEESGTGVIGKLREDTLIEEEIGTVPLWLHEKMLDPSTEGADKTFLRWGFVRGTPRIRKHSGRPDFENPANLMLRLRKKYGKGARADCITYLSTGKRGSSNAIASTIKYKQPSVYRALEQLVSAGVVRKYGQAGWNDYWIDVSEVAAETGLRGKRPVFLVWPDIFRAFYLVMRDFVENGSIDGSSLKGIERARELTVSIVPLLRNAGEPLAHMWVPDIRKSGGERNVVELREFLLKALKEIEVFVMDEQVMPTKK